MKVNNIENRTTFGSIETGTCFESNSQFFMKIGGGAMDEDNAVNLKSGQIFSFYDHDMVIAYHNAEVTLK